MINIASILSIQPVFDGRPTAPGPLAFQFENPAGIRYHVSGRGFVARSLRDATRHMVNPAWTAVPIDPLTSKGGHLTCYAVLDITAVEESTIRANWGTLELRLSPTDFHTEAGNAVLPLLGSVVRGGGTPFGPVVYATDRQRSVELGSIFQLGFLLPPERRELLLPLPPSGARTPREILCRIHLLGFFFHTRTFAEGFSIWRKPLTHAFLQLITGFSCQPDSIALLNRASEPILTRPMDCSYTELHPLLVSFISSAKTAASQREIAGQFTEIFR